MATSPAQPEVIPYADSRLQVGKTGYRHYAYPSDRAGMWIGRVTDDGVVLRLEPGPVVMQRLLFLGVVAALVVMYIAFRFWGDPTHVHTLAFNIPAFIVLALLIFFLFVFPYARNIWRRRAPWIEVDRAAKEIRLPREPKCLAYADVVRLQVVSLASVGFSWPKLGGVLSSPRTGELQVVWRGDGGEQTWCIVAHPQPDALKKFAMAFRQATDIPVALVYPLLSGDFKVEAFDSAATTA